MYTTGSGLGSFGGPVVMQLLLDTYRLSGAVLIISALTSHYFLCAALFIPVQKKVRVVLDYTITFYNQLANNSLISIL